MGEHRLLYPQNILRQWSEALATSNDDGDDDDDRRSMIVQDHFDFHQLSQKGVAGMFQLILFHYKN